MFAVDSGGEGRHQRVLESRGPGGEGGDLVDFRRRHAGKTRVMGVSSVSSGTSPRLSLLLPGNTCSSVCLSFHNPSVCLSVIPRFWPHHTLHREHLMLG